MVSWPEDTPKGATALEKSLWSWRTAEEAGHRTTAWLNAGPLIYEPSIMGTDTATAPKLNVRDFKDVCNKSVPLYVLTDDRWKLLAITLHNYIYRRWFRPYQSELENGQFICKFIALHSENLGAEPIVGSILSFNERLSEQVEDCRRIYDAAEPDTLDPTGSGLFLLKDHQVYQIRPLFRALLIIVDSKNYHLEDSKTVGDMRVSLVRTGIEDGLSAPITFDIIQQQAETEATDNLDIITTTLRVAIDFVIALEDQERGASTSAPAPSARYLRAWKNQFGDQEPVRYPTSRLVSDEKAVEWGWCGESKDYDSRAMTMIENRIRGTFI
ncbi:hypothetical protein BR93DRAFT_777424 [Coniochaeta sp. PMI_546]|nr:hypothetical protein BR93DRAFT_777424 [Coniochaeta sp. PMI_546]